MSEQTPPPPAPANGDPRVLVRKLEEKFVALQVALRGDPGYGTRGILGELHDEIGELRKAVDHTPELVQHELKVHDTGRTASIAEYVIKALIGVGIMVLTAFLVWYLGFNGPNSGGHH